MAKLSKVINPRRNDKQVEVWLINAEGREYCHALFTYDDRNVARQMRWEYFYKYCEPEVYLGAGI